MHGTVTRRTPQAPFTIARLRRLAKGEKMIYYTGHIQEDILSSDPRDRRNGAGLMGGYRTLLVDVWDTAQRLAADGKVTLSEQSQFRGQVNEHGGVWIKEYIAVGV